MTEQQKGIIKISDNFYLNRANINFVFVMDDLITVGMGSGVYYFYKDLGFGRCENSFTLGADFYKLKEIIE